jgi:hypothetical protein
MLGAQGLWARRDLYRATPTVTRDLSFSSFIRWTASFSRLLRHAWGCRGPILTRFLKGTEVLYSIRCTVCQTYWAVNILLYPVWPLISKLIGVIDSLGCTTVPSLMSVKQRVLKIFGGQYLNIIIDRSHLFLKMYQCDKFEVHHAKCSQNIEWSVYSYVRFNPWLLDLKINYSGYLLFRTYVWSLSSKGFSRYWVVSIILCPVWPLIYDLMT